MWLSFCSKHSTQVGDEILFTGETTGAYEDHVEECGYSYRQSTELIKETISQWKPKSWFGETINYLKLFLPNMPKRKRNNIPLSFLAWKLNLLFCVVSNLSMSYSLKTADWTGVSDSISKIVLETSSQNFAEFPKYVLNLNAASVQFFVYP